MGYLSAYRRKHRYFFQGSLFLSGVLYLVSGTLAFGVQSRLAYLGDDGILTYGLYANEGETAVVNRLAEFSVCGYRGGGVAIADVPVSVTVRPQSGDDTKQIQNAIDTVSSYPPDADGFRGAVLLRAGRYQVSSSLRIQASGVILRGEGQDSLGTVLEAVTPSDYDVIVLGSGSGSYGVQSGTIRAITTAYVPAGAIQFEVDNVAGYSVGEFIIVQRTPNQFWIDDLAMGQWGWTPSGYKVEYERHIAAILGNTITVDVPLVDVIQDKYGGGRIYKPTTISRIRQSGVENLRIESCYAGDTDEEHPWNAVRVRYAEDCWVRGITAQYFAYSCVNVSAYARRVTIEDCAFLDPKSLVTGGRRYSFNLESTATRILFQRCYSSESRHDFVLGSKTRGPNAFVDCYADRSFADSGPHHRWSTGALFDNVYSSNTLAVENRQSSGSGHGWSGAQIVFWNCQATNQKCDAPKGAMNFAIGSHANKREGSWAPEEPFGWWEHQWQVVTPRSLYFQQLADRRGEAAVDAVALPAQREGRIWDALSAWKGEDRFQPCPLRDEPKDQPLVIGASVIFEVVPQPNAAIVEYQWYEVFDSDYIRIGDNGPLLILSNAQVSDFGRTFFCRVVTDKGPYWSERAKIVNAAGPTNIALGQPARTSSVYGSSYTADKAVDGQAATFWNSAASDDYPWWVVDTQQPYSIAVVRFINRATATASLLARLSDLQVEVLDGPWPECEVIFTSALINPGNVMNIQNEGPNGQLTCPLPPLTTGRYVRVSKLTGPGQSYSDTQTNIAEIQVFAAASIPPAPEQLTAQPDDGKITLNWKNIDDADICGYVVYRSTTQGGGYRRIAEALTECVYRDESELDINTRYYYCVRAENTAGQLSNFSNEAAARPQFSPAAPRGIGAAGSDGVVYLVWQPATQPDFLHYTVYRSRFADSGFLPIVEGVTGYEYLDESVENGKTYYYTLTITNEEGTESAFCEPTAVIPSVWANFPENAALHKPTTASSYYADAVPGYAVDGLVLDYPYIWHSGRFDTDLQPWIQIDLEAAFAIERVLIYNRNHPGTYSRNRDFDLDIHDDRGGLVWSNYDETTGQGELINPGNRMNSPAVIDYIVPYNALGRFVKLTKRSGLVGDAATANISEIEVCPRLLVAPVTGLTVQGGKQSVLLRWDIHPDPAADFCIYRRSQTDSDYFRLAYSGGTTAFTDTTAMRGTWYYYSVTAVDDRGHESGYCPEQPAALILSADLDNDNKVDWADFSVLSRQWLTDGFMIPSADIAPEGGDGIVNIDDLLVVIEQWLINNFMERTDS
jgi:fibronectin type 3 domain-containing protein